MRSIVTILIYFLITLTSYGQSSWSKEYDLGEGRRNFLKDILVLENTIFISSEQFCPSSSSSDFHQCYTLSKYGLNGERVGSKTVELSGLSPNNNLISKENSLILFSEPNIGAIDTFEKISILTPDLVEEESRLIEFTDIGYTIPRGISNINNNLYLYGTFNTYLTNKSNAFFAKLDDSLNAEIIHTYPARQASVFMNDLQETPDGNLAFILKQKGPANPTGWFGYEIYKVRPNGEILDTFNFEDYIGNGQHNSLVIDNKGNYYFHSYLNPITNLTPSIGRINKLNKGMKSLEWSLTLPNDSLGREYTIERSTLARNGDLIVCGSVYDYVESYDLPHTTYNGFITRLDQQGNILWHHIYKVPNAEYLPQSEYGRYRFSQLNKIVEMEDGSLLAGGNHAYHHTVYGHPDFDDNQETNLLWLLKVDADGCLEEEECNEVIEIGKGFANVDIPLGTTWTYEVKDHPAGKTQFNKYVIEDTVMWQGKLAYQLKPGLKGEMDYLYIENDQYYFWDEDLNDYQLNFDFGESKSYEIPFMQNGQLQNATITIDSLNQEIFDGQLIDVQYVSTDFGINNPTNLKFYRGIGASWSGPRLHVGEIYDNITDDVQKIRCFENNSIQINFLDYPCDTIWQTLSINDKDTEYKLNLYPNPTDDKFNIDFPQENVMFRIVDLKGKAWKYGRYTKGVAINVENIPVGVYFVHIIDDKGQLLQSQKLLLVK